MDGEVFEWVAKALRESHIDEKHYHDEMITGLQRQYQKLQEGKLVSSYQTIGFQTNLPTNLWGIS